MEPTNTHRVPKSLSLRRRSEDRADSQHVGYMLPIQAKGGAVDESRLLLKICRQKKELQMSNIRPNRYILEAHNGFDKVVYETSSFIGQPTLTLTLGSPTSPARQFSGSQIRSVDTEIGTVVTVTTHLTIDAGSTSFSILIPAITLSSISDRVAFATEAIVTSHSGPIPVPKAGVHETYQFIPMKGEASFVFTVFETLTSKK
jgi:hypothetical protein